jgi:hypothetical protein
MLGCIDKRIVTGKGDIIVTKIWHVPISRYYPDGIKFSFVFIHDNKRYLGFDNAENKGCHKHYMSSETSEELEMKINESNPEKILRNFKTEVTELIKSLYERG